MASGTARKKFAFALGVLAAVLLAGVYVAQLRGQFAAGGRADRRAPAAAQAPPGPVRVAFEDGSDRLASAAQEQLAVWPKPRAPKRARSSRSRPFMPRGATSRASGISRPGVPRRSVMPSRPTASPQRGCAAASARQAWARAWVSRWRSVEAPCHPERAGWRCGGRARACRVSAGDPGHRADGRRGRGAAGPGAGRRRHAGAGGHVAHAGSHCNAIEAIARAVPEAVVGAGPCAAPPTRMRRTRPVAASRSARATSRRRQRLPRARPGAAAGRGDRERGHDGAAKRGYRC